MKLLFIAFAVDVLAKAVMEIGSVVDLVLLCLACLELTIQLVSAHGVTFRDLLKKKTIRGLSALRSAAPRPRLDAASLA